MNKELQQINTILNLITLFGVLWVSYLFFLIRKKVEKRQVELFRKLDNIVKLTKGKE